MLGPTAAPVDETAPLNPAEISAWRAPHEQRVLAAASAGVRPIVIRPGIVYGGCRGIVGDLFKDAANSLVRVIGPGDNHWPLVYDRDLAELYVRLATNPEASGVFHANDEGDETVNDIVRRDRRHAPTSPSIRHVPLAEARQKMGRATARAGARPVAAQSRARRALGWNPSLHSVSRPECRAAVRGMARRGEV